MSLEPAAISTFRYLGYELDAERGTLTCRYALDDAVEFEEVIRAEPGDGWRRAAVGEAARLVFLLAGVSYYKAAAPPIIDLGETPIRSREREFLRTFYIDGLGEFAYRNGLDLTGISLTGGVAAGRPASPTRGTGDRPLIPFGGGLDSIVTVESTRAAQPDAALFILSRHGVHFDAIETAAAVTRLPILRADQQLDEKIRRSAELGYRNGHVPVTGVLSAIAVLVAMLHGRDSVVMSNEWSASVGNTTAHGRVVNHQWSKSLAFEESFREVLAGAFDPAPDFYSFLRPYSELWVAERFAQLDRYQLVFRSCNRAFHIDPAQRLARWCGTCEKCAFIDLVLAPFLGPVRMEEIFGGTEPLDNPGLRDTFRTLLGVSGDVKPFECVGDVDECRVAAVLSADRPDRADQTQLHRLVTELGGIADAARHAAPTMLEPLASQQAAHVITS
jgi:UDP-N-acetyl-alpha-D-muramoyl-L-alanyl-L-glutamate epimerase